MNAPCAIGPLRGNFVMLRAGALRLLLPQDQVGAARHHDGQGAVAALSEAMTLLPACPPDRFIVATVGDEAPQLQWCWNELRVLIDIALDPKPVPPALLAPHTPVDRHVDLDGELAFLCNAQSLTRFVQA